MKKENITIEDSFEEFNNYIEKINKLKEKTEKEMLKLDQLYDNTLKNLENSFEEKQMIRSLSYISKINKNKKEMKALLGEKMKNLKIEYIKEENNIIHILN